MVLRLSALASVAVAALAAGGAAFAQTPPIVPAPSAPAADEDEVILKADQFEEDRDTRVVTASGNVEVRIGQRTLRADRVIYDRVTETLRAQGNVQITDGTGQVQFADEIEADEDFTNGFATRFSARLGETGLVTASSAVRTDGVRNSVEQVVFTNCPVCEEKGVDPTWALRARRATLDQDESMISYQDAVLELGGVPVLYVPWFAHPDPNSERRSGLVTPDLGLSSKIGAYYEQPYLWVISPSEDLTIAPMVSTGVNPLVKVDWRRRFFSGFIDAESSFTYEQDFDSDGEKFDDREWRGHLYAVGRFNINEDWQWGFGVERQTDDLYDQRYDIDGEDDLRGLIASQPRQLLSQIYTTGQTPDFYFETGAYAFQGLRAGDRDTQIPEVLPAIYTQKVFDFGSAGQLATDFSAVGLFRAEQQTLPNSDLALDTARATAEAEWGTQFIFGPGLVFEPFASGRGDAYRIDDGGAGGARDVSRFLGVAGATVSHPWIARSPGMDIIVEPIAMVAYGTPDANEQLNPGALPGDPTFGRSLIPNEDSLVFEADESNLFKPSAVSNYDLWEGGARGAVGVNTVARIGKDIELSALVGRRWREDADPAFNELSNLSGEESDYVASVRADLGRIFRVGARFRTNEELEVRRIDMDASVDFWRIRGDARYFRVEDTSTTPGVSTEDEGLVWNGAFEIDNRWAAVVQQARNISQEQDIRFSLGLRYMDECSYFMIAYERSGGRDRTLGPSESIRFTFALTGLGGVTPNDFD